MIDSKGGHISQAKTSIRNTSSGDRLDIERLRSDAIGRWALILSESGVGESFLRNRQGPCPVCAGKTRFRFDDKNGTGTWYCQHGDGHAGGKNAGDGFALLADFLGVNFIGAAKRVSAILYGASQVVKRPATTSAAPVPNSLKQGRARELWARAKPARNEPRVVRYLESRGIAIPEVSHVLRFLPQLAYFDDEGKPGQSWPVMLASVQAPDGSVVGCHITYLDRTDPRKAPVESPRKLRGSGCMGGAIRLFPAGPKLAVGEGIETAYAAHLLTGRPAWATVSADMLAGLVLPAEVQDVAIFADADALKNGHRAGIEAAMKLKARCQAEGRRAVLHRAIREGADANDVLKARLSRRAA